MLVQWPFKYRCWVLTWNWLRIWIQLVVNIYLSVTSFQHGDLWRVSKLRSKISFLNLLFLMFKRYVFAWYKRLDHKSMKLRSRLASCIILNKTVTRSHDSGQGRDRRGAGMSQNSLVSLGRPGAPPSAAPARLDPCGNVNTSSFIIKAKLWFETRVPRLVLLGWPGGPGQTRSMWWDPPHP